MSRRWCPAEALPVGREADKPQQHLLIVENDEAAARPVLETIQCGRDGELRPRDRRLGIGVVNAASRGSASAGISETAPRKRPPSTSSRSLTLECSSALRASATVASAASVFGLRTITSATVLAVGVTLMD